MLQGKFIPFQGVIRKKIRKKTNQLVGKLIH
jgi:hypothetical protein